MIFFCVSLCLRLVFIVCMYYVTVIALSYHVSVVMCFVHIIIITNNNNNNNYRYDDE